MIIKPKATIQVNKLIDYKPPILDGLVVIRDTREQLPYEFRGIEIVDEKIEWGDYSIVGFKPQVRHDDNLRPIPNGIAIERKSVSDFYNSITYDRERFKRMFNGFKNYVDFKGLVIEGNECVILCPELNMSNINPHSIYGTLVSIEICYGVHIYYGNRQSCELKTLSWLSYYYKVMMKEILNDNIKKPRKSLQEIL